MRTLLQWLELFGAIFLIILLGELSPVKAFAVRMDAHRQFLLLLTIAVAFAGALALIWGFAFTARSEGHSMSGEEFEQLAARTQIIAPGKRFSKAKFHGNVSGVVLPERTWTFQEMKAGRWNDPAMRRKYLITAGGTLFALGGFAVVMVLVRPPSVKLMLLGAVVYALVRLTWAFWRA